MGANAPEIHKIEGGGGCPDQVGPSGNIIAPPVPRARVGQRLRFREDGSLSRRRAEEFALGMADGMERGEAWRSTGAAKGGGAIEDRRQIESDAAFQARVAMLTEERGRMEQLGPLGDAMWAAKQTWRAARAAGDLAATMRSAELMGRLAEKLPAPAGASAEPVSGGAGPGRPAQVPAATRVDIERIKGDLLKRGIAPEPASPGG